MVPRIADAEVNLLASIAATLESEYSTDEADPWAGSPFEWIKGRPSRQVGAIGEKLVAGWCAAKDFDVVRSPDSDADRIIHGYRVEVKFSTLWKGGGYKFQQVRDQRYEYLFCLGVAPFDANAWLIPKAVLFDYVIGPDSEGHEMLMSLFGGLSKAERRRLQIRTRNAMLAHAAAGRWLGGRPNYGYRLVDTDQPHPQRQKAAAGIRLRVLEPDPETAPVVRRIFELFDARVGYRSIANRLEADGLPSPGEVGPTRHPRSARVWSGSAVRAILTNPRYLGHQVAGRQRRKDELLDPADPAAGTTSRQRWQPTEAWVTSDDPAWPAIVDADLWERVNARITNTRGPQRRRPRATPGTYLLAGLVRCKVCGRSMHGATLKGNPYYRCNRVRPDYADTGHPRTTAIREYRIVSVLDDWLSQLTDAEHRQTTIATVLAADTAHAPEPPETNGPE